jgi:hypothetical protein
MRANRWVVGLRVDGKGAGGIGVVIATSIESRTDVPWPSCLSKWVVFRAQRDLFPDATFVPLSGHNSRTRVRAHAKKQVCVDPGNDHHWPSRARIDTHRGGSAQSPNALAIGTLSSPVFLTRRRRFEGLPAGKFSKGFAFPGRSLVETQSTGVKSGRADADCSVFAVADPSEGTPRYFSKLGSMGFDEKK